VIVAGKQSQANKNYWAAVAIWQAKVAEALARRRAAEKARLEALRRAQKPPTAPPPSQPVLTPFMRFLLLLGISLLVVMASGSTVTSVDNRFAKPITVADSTIEESQSVTHICYQFIRSTPFPFDDLLCGGVNVIENFDDVVRLADDIAERIVTGTMTSASNIRQLHDSNVLSFNYAHALNPIDEDSQENVLTDVGDLVDEDDSQYITLYHYTRVENVDSILAAGLRPSLLSSGRDAQQGDGHYFTDLTPEESSTLTRGQHSAALFVSQWQWGGQPPLPIVAWIEISVPQQNVQRVAPLYGQRVSYRSIYLSPSSSILPIASYVMRTGILEFQPGPKGNR